MEQLYIYGQFPRNNMLTEIFEGNQRFPVPFTLFKGLSIYLNIICLNAFINLGFEISQNKATLPTYFNDIK